MFRPINIQKDTDLTKKALPWQQPKLAPKIRVSYDIYIGEARSNDLLKWMLDVLNLQFEEIAIDAHSPITARDTYGIHAPCPQVFKAGVAQLITWKFRDKNRLVAKLRESGGRIRLASAKINGPILCLNQPFIRLRLKPHHDFAKRYNPRQFTIPRFKPTFCAPAQLPG
jgi:hypothetical protein